MLPDFISCLRGTCGLLIVAASFAAQAPLPAGGALQSDSAVATPITTVAAAFARWPDLKTDDQPVRIEGVITGMMPSGAFRMHDGELGIYVTKSPAAHELTAGDRVAVSGVLRKGGFSPWITPHTLTRLGRGVFPPARPASFSELASGAIDNQWVEIEGVVRGVHVPDPSDFVVLDLGMSGGHLRVLVNYEPGVKFESLVDAAVRLRGVAAVNVNAHKHVVEASFRVPSFSEIGVLQAGRTDPFAQPLVPVQRLMRFSLGVPHHHRVRTSGVVTRQLSDTVVFIRDGEVGLKVETQHAGRFQPGETIEVAGFPEMADGMAVLQHSLTRAAGAVQAVEPVEPTLATLLEGTHNSNLVRMRARLVDWVIAGPNVTLVFQSGDQLFKGLFNLPPGTSLSLPDKNSLVNVTGICVINELEDIWFYQPRSFVLLVAGLADLQLVQAPPWWTPERLWRALSITCGVLLAAGGWVWALRRQIGRKLAVIEQQARHAAALEERSRIARELHDTLEQGLTGLSLQMKAMETDLDGTPHPVRSRLQFARQMLRQSRALARNAIREMRTEAVPARLEGLIDGLKRIADSWNHSGALRVEIKVIGEVRAVLSRIEHHLLGIGTEAMTNAVKHGRAETIHIEIEFRPAEIVLRIKDNGAGFDPAQQLERASGCFGLLGMRERARELRGELRIHSQPEQGTEIIATAPIEPAYQAGAVRASLDLPAKARSPASAAT
jgi:signal transduction histidine kinase